MRCMNAEYAAICVYGRPVSMRGDCEKTSRQGLLVENVEYLVLKDVTIEGSVCEDRLETEGLRNKKGQ